MRAGSRFVIVVVLVLTSCVDADVQRTAEALEGLDGPRTWSVLSVPRQSYRRVAWCFGGSKRGRIRMALDYYREAIEIAELLETEGYTDESGALKLAVASGATATEILMALRWHLERLGRSGRMNDETSARMRKLSAAIGVVLG